MIKVENVSKAFKATRALKDINLEVSDSELFGLIGPDGAGKSTLLRIIATLLIPDKGSATVLGLNTVSSIKELRSHIGYMPGRFSLYQDLSVEENLKFYASVFGTTVNKNYHLIKDIYSHIEPFKKRLAGKLSGGMKQKLALCCALIHAPKLMILDEPTTGVDAVSRAEFWEMLQNLKHQNITIIVSTPYMDEASKCDKVALIQSGEIMLSGMPDAIPKTFGSILHSVKACEKFKLIQSLKAHPKVEGVYTFGDSVHITYTKNIIHSTLKRDLINEGLTNLEIKDIRPGIEDTFLKLMQHQSNE